MAAAVSRRGLSELRRVLDWYFEHRYGKTEGPGATPFYCDPAQVGAFAVPIAGLARGTEEATFRLFVVLAMYQALRDVVVQRRQRALTAKDVEVVADLRRVRAFRESGRCPGLREAPSVVEYCDVWKRDGRVDCHRHPGLGCDVKTATRAFNRMGDLGKLPSAAFEVAWSGDGLRGLFTRVSRKEASATGRARVLVGELQRVHRVGAKLATLFVSALSTPALAPAVSPWWPEVDGNTLVVVDTNVAHAVESLRGSKVGQTYQARARWIESAATRIDLRSYHPEVPRYSPRLVQQALYAFCSRSNRLHLGDACRPRHFATCARSLCPFE